MANTYQWSFPALTAYPQNAGQTDVVFNIHYVLKGTDGQEHSSSVYGTVDVTYTEGEPFTPFNELTEQQIQSWTESALGQQRVTEMKTIIDTQIQEQVTPTFVTLTPPWVTT